MSLDLDLARLRFGPLLDDDREDAVLDFRLQYEYEKGRSPCIDEGAYAPWMLEATDLDGNPRVKHVRPSGRNRVDIGCYESPYWPKGLMMIVQ